MKEQEATLALWSTMMIAFFAPLFILSIAGSGSFCL